MTERGWNLIRSKPGFAPEEGQWVGQKQLGEGGQGFAALFVRRDPSTQNIMERMVVKEAWPVEDWNDEYKFFGPNKEYPREHYMSMIMPNGSNNTINVMGSRLFPDKDCFRLYMEYCPGGDLKTLFRSYRDRSLSFPEPYLWKVFQDLARAVHAMDNPSGHGFEGDEAIAHIDFKPSNVFLCLPDKDDFPKYPIAKLADFGGTIICSPRDTEETRVEKFESAAFSPGYVAPDVERFFKNNDADRIPVRDTRPGVTLADIPRRITTATNIWNAALIMADLISPQRFIKPDWTRQAYSARDTWLDNFINQKDTDPRMQGYSKLLKDTVIQCLSYMPGQRPTPTDLLARVDHGVNQYSGVMQTRDCFNTTKYSGQYDLNPSVPFSDDYPVTQPEDWEMADDEDDDEDDDDDEGFTPIKRPGGGGPTPKTPHVEAPDKARRSKTTTAGAPQDTPLKGFVVGPDAGEATRHFWDPDPDYERVEPSESRHDYVDDSLLRQAFEGDMPNEPIG